MAEDVRPASPGGDAGLKFIQFWAESLSSVLGQIAGKPFPFAAQESAPTSAEATGKDVEITVTAAGPVRGEMCLRIPSASAAALAKAFAGERAEGDLSDEDRAAVEEILRQVAGYVSTSGEKIWPELQLNLALSAPPTWPPAASGWIGSVAGAPAEIAMEWNLSAALNTSLVSAAPEQKQPAVQGSTVSSDPARLGFFMDLELEVTLRFGGRDVLLKDILQLGPGSVLELDREIQDPADLLLDGKLIARGEVVMVDGNYGLRVTEVVAPHAA